MRKLAWHSSFLRAFKTRTRHQPALRQRILTVVERMSQAIIVGREQVTGNN